MSEKEQNVFEICRIEKTRCPTSHDPAWTVSNQCKKQQRFATSRVLHEPDLHTLLTRGLVEKSPPNLLDTAVVGVRLARRGSISVICSSFIPRMLVWSDSALLMTEQTWSKQYELLTFIYLEQTKSTFTRSSGFRNINRAEKPQRSPERWSKKFDATGRKCRGLI